MFAAGDFARLGPIDRPASAMRSNDFFAAVCAPPPPEDPS
jgi:hypothetical protein